MSAVEAYVFQQSRSVPPFSSSARIQPQKIEKVKLENFIKKSASEAQKLPDEQPAAKRKTIATDACPSPADQNFDCFENYYRSLVKNSGVPVILPLGHGGKTVLRITGQRTAKRML